MRVLVFVAIAALALPAGSQPKPEERPLTGDVVHGRALLASAKFTPRVDGAWLNAATDEQILAKLERGGEGFPQIESDNVLDRWDVVTALRATNTDLRDLLGSADTVLVMGTKLDDNAETRLKDQAKIAAGSIERERRVFGLYDLDGKLGPAPTFVGEKDTKKRDQLKKTTKVGYVVFQPIPGFRDGKHEAAFAVDKDIKLVKVFIRAPDGTAPVDLNQAATRFVGKGARGQYGALKPAGAGKALAELEKPLSDAFLLAMESVYMFEVAEREYFAFDD